jgi:hypothetical protein
MPRVGFEKIGGYRVPRGERLYTVREIYDSVYEHLRICFENAENPSFRYRVYHDELSDEVNVSDNRLISGVNVMLAAMDKVTNYEFSDGGGFFPLETSVRFRAKVLLLYPKNVQYGALEMLDIMDYLEMCLMTYQDEDMGRRILFISAAQVGTRGIRVVQHVPVNRNDVEELRLRAYLNFQVFWNYV